jgi:hypothetical protein
MRTRERGIGNLPFIALLVLLVIAIGLFFVKQSDADKFEGLYRTEKAKADKANDIQLAAGNAYDAWFEVSGLALPELRRSGDGGQVYPEPAKIKDAVTTWLMAQATEITGKSQAKLNNKVFRVEGGSVVKMQQTGDTTTITLYGTPLVKETVTFQGFVAPLGEQFRYAAKAIEDNNKLYEDEYKSFQTRLAEHQKRNTEQASQFTSDTSSKAQLFDTEKTRADNMQDQVNTLQAARDSDAATIAQEREAHGKYRKQADLQISALKDGLTNTKKKIDIAMKEDPEDGEVLVADARQGLVFLNRGRNFRVAPDMRFVIWRIGKGNVREDVAEVEVIEVGDTSSTARVLKLARARVPVAQGMKFSNPFYDPFKKLRVHIYGNLRYYPSDLAKRRLAESGCTVAERLDDTVNVVVLGEPAVDLDMEAGSPEEAAANEERAKAQREARVRQVMETAASLGAVVVTEEVLQTFIEY